MKSKAVRVLLWTALAFAIMAAGLLYQSNQIGGWGALLPGAQGLLSGLIALILLTIGGILGGVNYAKRVSQWSDKQAKVKRNKRDLGILGVAVTSFTVLFMVTFMAPIPTVEKNIETVQSMSTDLPEFFTLQENATNNVIRFCLPFQSCYVDAEVHINVSAALSPGEFCKTYIAWAVKNGGKYIGDTFGSLEIKKYPIESQLACVARGGAVAIEGTKDGVSWSSLGSTEIYLATTQSQRLVSVSSNFEDRLSDWERQFAVLDRIGKWRKAHPGARETASTIKQAVKGLDGISHYKVVTDANGVGPWLAYQTAGGSPVGYCVRVAPWDEKYFGISDPGHGYYPNQYGDPNQFATVTFDECVRKAGD